MAQDSLYSEKETNRFCKVDVQVIGLDLVCHYLGLSLSSLGNCSFALETRTLRQDISIPVPPNGDQDLEQFRGTASHSSSGGRPSFSFWFCPLWLCDSQQDSLSPWILSLLCFCLLAFKRGFHSFSQTGFELFHSLYWPWIHNPLHPGSWVLELWEWATSPAS